MAPDGTTIGVWIGERDAVLSEFDDTLECGPNHGSRSAEVKDPMATAIKETLGDAEYESDTPVSKRHFVRQAILDCIRRESDNIV